MELFSTESLITERNGKPAGSPTRVGVVHDWLPVYAGAERVLEEILSVVPQADLYSLIDFLPAEQRAFLDGKDVHTSFIQNLPFARNKYRYYLPLAPLAVEQFDLRGYDVVISSSYAVAKGALTKANQLHICYIHSPVRYAWDLYPQYMEQDRMGSGLRGLMARLILHYLRMYDVSTAHRVDRFVANSKHVARRVWNTYRRKADVIYPPVDTEAFSPWHDKDDYYVALSRLVPYKRMDLIVEAFSTMPDKELLVIGDGPERGRLKKLAGDNVKLLGYQPAEAVQHYMQRARALVFAAEEDFGIVPVEAQACGTPVIAYGRGGAKETVVPGETGVFFGEQTVDSLVSAVQSFEAMHFYPDRIRENAVRFSKRRFQEEMSSYIDKAYGAFIAESADLHEWTES